MGRYRPSGPVIAYFDGSPIAESVVDAAGRRYVFAGIVPRGRDGAADPAALRPGEFVATPGLIYRLQETEPPRVRPCRPRRRGADAASMLVSALLIATAICLGATLVRHVTGALAPDRLMQMAALPSR